MRTPRAWIGKIADWIGRGRRERELAAEIEAHVELHAAENRRAGMTPDEARRAALLKLGGVEATREAMRDVWSVRWADTLGQDVRYALRALRRAPVFTAAAVVSLALGLGAGVAIFTVADSLLVRPMPYPDASQLVMVWESKRAGPNASDAGLVPRSSSPGNYLDWKTQGADLFASMGAFRENRTSVLAVGTRVEELRRLIVSAELLTTLGVQPIRGRLFTAEDDRPGGSPSILISHRVWQDWFGGDPAIVGRTVQLSFTPRTIVGVLPPEFYFRDRTVDVWEPFGLNPAQDYRNTEGRYLFCVARMKPGVTRAQAQARMIAIAAQTEAAYPIFNKGWSVRVESIRDVMVADIKAPLLVLLGAVGLLLTVSCANVAGLLLARSQGRRRELALRASLGAGRGRVVRLLLTESLVLGLAAGLVALLLARSLVAVLLALAPQSILRGAGDVQVDWRVIVFGVVLSLVTALLFGLVPALIATGRRLVNPLRDDSRSTTGHHGGARAWLVTAEVALTVVLLIGAVLLFRTLVGLQAVNPGLDPTNVLTLRVSMPAARYLEAPKRTQFITRALAEIDRLPGVRAATASGDLPFGTFGPPANVVTVEGRPPDKPGEERFAAIRTVMPGYFRAMGIPIRSGREFTAADNSEAAPMRFVVNEAFVRTFLTDRPPLGARVRAPLESAHPFGEIIGVVGDVKEGALDKPARPSVYYVYERLAFTMLFVAVRAHGDPRDLAEPIRRVIAGIDPAQPIADVRTMDDVVGQTVARQRFSAVLLSSFSLLSLLLACVGIYGVLAYAVAQRTREIGVRIALGARPAGIVWLVVGTGARMVVAGLIAGLASALALTRLIEPLLFGINSHDLTTFVGVTMALTTVALAAATFPAYRASRLDPTLALRGD